MTNELRFWRGRSWQSEAAVVLLPSGVTRFLMTTGEWYTDRGGTDNIAGWDKAYIEKSLAEDDGSQWRLQELTEDEVLGHMKNTLARQKAIHRLRAVDGYGNLEEGDDPGL